ncbi:hypothetical protein, partial [Paraburkholderia aspalathi]
MASKHRIVGNAGIVSPAMSDLERFVPDLPDWPASWRFEDQDVPFGQALVTILTPFLLHLLDSGYSRKTLNRHRDHLWMLGGHLIEVRHEDPDAAAMDARTLVLNQIHEYGGPLISRHLNEDAQNAFDAT